jgi:PmbA protein
VSVLADAPARETFDPAATERELSARCAHLVAAAKARGADEAEVFGSRARTIAVRFEKGDLKLAQVDEGSTLGLRIFRGQRLGFTSTNQADPAALERCADESLALARFAPPDVHNKLPGARPIGKQAPLSDPALAELPVEDVVELGRRFVELVAQRDKRLSIDAASVELVRNSQAIWATTGVHASESDCLFSCSIGALAVDGEDVGGMHYEGDAVRTRAALDATLEQVADSVASNALANLAAAHGESYKGAVLFAPDAFFDVFVAPIVGAASAIAVQRGRSPLAGKLGTRIASELFEILDDPTDRSLAGCGSFDREGQPAVPYPLVTRGALAGYLYNGYAAAVEGRHSTGNATGGARGVPGLGAHALVVRGGPGGTREQILAQFGRGLFVQRFSGTVDAASGDFSGVAKSSRWVEEGRIVRPVREMLLSGNLYRLLHELRQLSSVQERLSGSARAPYAIVDGLSVTAG